MYDRDVYLHARMCISVDLWYMFGFEDEYIELYMCVCVCVCVYLSVLYIYL